jgi:hypothetical protein
MYNTSFHCFLCDVGECRGDARETDEIDSQLVEGGCEDGDE